jgi:outer membrane protein assembly factor BamA
MPGSSPTEAMLTHLFARAGIFFALFFFVPLQALAADALKTHDGGKQKRTIRNIKIEIRNVFDEPDLAWFYRAVNQVKIQTKEAIVRRELLFAEGDEYNEFLIAESERSLRRIPFLRQISITPIPEGEFVDIVVSVQDTWTLFPFISFSLGGGTNKSSIGVAETNLLGYGKRMEMLYADDEGREKVEGVWDDQRFLGTYQQLTVGIFDRSDGYRTVGYYGRPFRSLVEPYSFSINTDFFDLVDKLFSEGEESYIFREHHEAFSGGFTMAFGDPSTRVHRVTLGYDYSASTFEEADEKDFEDVDVDPDSVSHDPAKLASDRKFSGPFIALQSITPDFVSMNFVDRFERVEDYNLGNELYGRFTFAPEALGSDRDTLLLNVSDADGVRFSPTAFARGKIGLVSRVNTDSANNTIATADFRYDYVMGAKYWGRTYMGKHTLVGSLAMDVGDRLDKDKQFLLGASNGLRGYKDRMFTGNQSLVLNLEERTYIAEDLYHLISVGTVVFFDAGGTSNQGVGDILTDELHSDVGIGLRIGFPRSSGGSVLRIDLAYPLQDSPDGTASLEPRILFTSGQLVSARLPNESDQSPGSNVTVQFLP